MMWTEDKREKYKTSPEKARENKRRWYEANLERHKESRKRFAESNPDKIKKYRKQWAKANPDKANSHVVNISDSYVRAKLKGNNIDPTPETIELKREQLTLHRLLKEIKETLNGFAGNGNQGASQPA